MTANQLIALLQALPADQRELQVVTIYDDRQCGIDAPAIVDSTERVYESSEDRWHRTYGSLAQPVRPKVIML